MRFGTSIPQHLLVRAVEEGKTKEVAATLAVIDQAGFEWIRIGDHIAHPGISHQENEDLDAVVYGDPFAVISWLSALNSNLRFVLGVLILPLRHPVLVAHAAATADRLSSGRVILGLGSGYARQEFAAVGVDYAERFARTEDHVQAIRKLLDEPRASFEGKFTHLDGVALTCKPAQDHLPIWLGGVGPKGADRAARLGDCWFPSLSGYGRPPGLTPRDVASRGAELQGVRKELGLPRLEIVGSAALGMSFINDPKPLEGPADPRDRHLNGTGTAEDLVHLLKAHEEAGLDGVVMDLHTEESLEGCRRSAGIFAERVRHHFS